MGVFSVPVTIGVDEEAIAKNIEQKVMCGTKNWHDDTIDHNNLTPLREMVKDSVTGVIKKHEDDIVKMAAEILADKLSRSKKVKEIAASVAEEAVK